MRAAYLAPVLLAACTFSAPGDGAPTGNGQGADGGGGGSGSQACADDDHDTVCNTLDDWPCGEKPNDPGNSKGDTDVSMGRQWGARNIAIGTDRRVIANPNQDFAAAFDWSIALYCGGGIPMCKGQIEFGYGDAPRTGCLFDGDVPSFPQNKGGHSDLMLRAPAMPGVYEIRLNAGRRSSCGANPWYGGEPEGNSTIAILCVPP